MRTCTGCSQTCSVRATGCRRWEDLEAVRDPGAVVLELPAREVGGQLPPWEELTTFCGKARERDIALHMDGPRLWQCAPFSERRLDEIATLFDTVCVSFHRDLGARRPALLVLPE
jgi:threonine aldolase